MYVTMIDLILAALFIYIFVCIFCIILVCIFVINFNITVCNSYVRYLLCML